MVREPTNDGAKAKPIQKLVLSLTQMQSNLCASFRTLDRFDAELALPTGFPTHPMLWASTGASGDEGYLVSNNEA